MTMSPEDVARRLRAELDAVPVPERPWAAVRPALARRRHKRRAMGAVAAVAVVVLVAGLGLAAARVIGAGPGLARRVTTCSRRTPEQAGGRRG